MKLRVFLCSIVAACALLATVAADSAFADPTTPSTTPNTPLNLSTLYTCQANPGGCTISAAWVDQTQQGHSFAIGSIANGYSLTYWSGGGMNGNYLPNVLHGVVNGGALSGYCAFTEDFDFTDGWFQIGSAMTPTTCNTTMNTDTAHGYQLIADDGNATYAYLPLANGCGSAPCWNGPCNEYLNEYPWSTSPALNGSLGSVPASTQADVRYAALYSPSGGQVYMIYDVTNNRWVFVQNGSPAGCYISP